MATRLPFDGMFSDEGASASAIMLDALLSRHILGWQVFCSFPIPLTVIWSLDKERVRGSSGGVPERFGALSDFYLDECSFLGGILEEYRSCRYTLLRDPLVVLYLSPQVPSVVVAGIALPALAFSLHLRPPLQQPCAVAVVVAFGRRCRGWVHEEEKKTGLHFPVAEDVWKYLTDVNPSFAAAGRWSSRTSPSPRSSPSCAATSLGSARSRASPAAGSLASKTPGSPSSPSTRSSPSRFDLRQGLAAPSVIAKLCRSLPRHRSCEVNLVHPSVASVRRRKIVAAVDSTSPPFEARRRPSSVAVCRRALASTNRRSVVAHAAIAAFLRTANKIREAKNMIRVGVFNWLVLAGACNLIIRVACMLSKALPPQVLGTGGRGRVEEAASGGASSSSPAYLFTAAAQYHACRRGRRSARARSVWCLSSLFVSLPPVDIGLAGANRVAALAAIHKAGHDDNAAWEVPRPQP
uniref:Uncharacterized protein n=1 Tax=Oryza sativa subsp. japonica TaxID=39947 RepID=Q69IW7_ORYSJ|nr:hypothetical protein [Oryza sativa Japonica Group]